MKLKRVMQIHNSSCAPATIATLTGISYIKAMRAIYPWKKTKDWNNYGTNQIDLMFALMRLGLKFRVRKSLTFPKKRNAIVLLEHEAYGPPGHRNHAVAWDCEQQRILDPDVGFGIKRHLPLSSYQKAAHEIIEIL